MSHPKISITALILLLAFAGVINGQVPHTIQYQGRLINSGGEPIADGDHTVWFRLYDQNIDGTLLWEDDITVSTSNGLFSARIGEDVTLPSSLFLDEGEYWLSVSYNSEEILPRTRIMAIPFAMVSEYTINITEGNITDFWTQAQAMADADGDGYEKLSHGGTDCDDFNANVNPGGTEEYGTVSCSDGWDNDCDGYIDGADTDCSVCQDVDDDGFDICDAADPNDTDGLPADCDDTDADVNPGVAEGTTWGNCDDGKDNDCDGDTDGNDSDCTTCVDGDGDGYDTCDSGDPGDTDGYPADCNDGDINIYPGATEIPDDDIDQDCNGYDRVTCIVDNDVDGYGTDVGTIIYSDYGNCNYAGMADNDTDCDDDDANVHPGATEIPDDGNDQDCNGYDQVTCIVDYDNDGYGTDVGTITYSDYGNCNQTGMSDNSLDCDDTDASVNPDGIEGPSAGTCVDGLDNDCDGYVDTNDSDCTACVDDDGDGYDTCDPGNPEDTDGYPADCDDSDYNVHPGATEIIGDGIDQDCDGGDLCYLDNDDDGFHDNSTVGSADLDCSDPGEADAYDPSGDCDDDDGSVYPGATEIVGDGIDQDCDGGDLCYLDNDDDGYHDNSTVGSADLDCSDPGEAEATDPDGDCDDDDAAVNPGATEICDNGIDDDCDGLIDAADPDCGG